MCADYGNPLKSRAERHLPDGSGTEKGLTGQEISELRRFQKQVRCDRALAREIKRGFFFLPHRDASIWLPIMQHYDEQFGTRLLDISNSVYTGLYFACISWDGEINNKKDGILYSFYLSNNGGGLIARGGYYDEMPEDFDEEFDNIAPKRVQDSFLDWEAPSYFRVYKSSSANPREAAQDGWFLVRGAIGKPAQYGQGFKFRVPGEVKEELIRQLWMAGYTPERIVRGERGRIAHKTLKRRLGMKF